MNEHENIFGCFVSIYASSGDARRDDNEDKGTLFRSYIWSDSGICGPLKALNHKDYGKDMLIILFQFYVNPYQQVLDVLKPIESYRRKERAIGIPIIVNNGNFFDKSELDRRKFLKESILDKMELLRAVVSKRRLDTNIDRLEMDLIQIVTEWATR